MIRLHKYLADKGIASRRKSEEYIEKWYVKVNWELITTLGTKVDPDKDVVEVDWMALQSENNKLVYYLLNKPVWYNCTTNRNKHEKDIILDLVPKEPRVFSVWRLDKDTTWLIILTNDWDLAFRLTHPSFDKEKEYEVLTKYRFTDEQLELLAWWKLIIEWRWLKKAIVTRRSNRSFSIILTEWAKRQIRKMVELIWNRVEKLRRIRIKNLLIWDLEVWKYRIITSKEINELKK